MQTNHTIYFTINLASTFPWIHLGLNVDVLCNDKTNIVSYLFRLNCISFLLKSKMRDVAGYPARLIENTFCKIQFETLYNSGKLNLNHLYFHGQNIFYTIWLYCDPPMYVCVFQQMCLVSFSTTADYSNAAKSVPPVCKW